jgi:hypothetical protein
MSVSQMAFPMVALPPLTELIRDLARKKRARSKMKASKATAAPTPETQVEKHDMENSRTWARRPKMDEMVARTRATRCRTRA